MAQRKKERKNNDWYGPKKERKKERIMTDMAQRKKERKKERKNNDWYGPKKERKKE